MNQLEKQISNETEQTLFEKSSVSLIEPKHWIYLQKRYHMTPRELEIATLVCQGFTNDEIAANLSIRQGTVKTHLRNIYRRVRVKNKISLLLRFVSDAAEVYDQTE